MRKRWAEYLTIIATGSFLPLEIYELVKHFSRTKTGVLLVNAAIVWYLVARLRAHKRERSASATG